jgi:RNA polymerase sigma-70 factor (ECF subfamily)
MVELLHYSGAGFFERQTRAVTCRQGDPTAVTTVSDQQLLSRVAGGDDGAFAALYDRYAARVLGFLVKLLRVRADADDVLQDTFCQVWSKAREYEPSRSSPQSWLFLLARSRAVDQLRRRKRQEDSAAPPPQAAPPDPAVVFEEKDAGARLRDALAKLTDEQRSAIQLAFYGGLTHEEVAARQSVPLGTVKTRIRLGMQRLRGLLSEKETVSA